MQFHTEHAKASLLDDESADVEVEEDYAGAFGGQALFVAVTRTDGAYAGAWISEADGRALAAQLAAYYGLVEKAAAPLPVGAPAIVTGDEGDYGHEFRPGQAVVIREVYETDSTYWVEDTFGTDQLIDWCDVTPALDLTPENESDRAPLAEGEIVRIAPDASYYTGASWQTSWLVQNDVTTGVVEEGPDDDGDYVIRALDGVMEVQGETGYVNARYLTRLR